MNQQDVVRNYYQTFGIKKLNSKALQDQKLYNLFKKPKKQGKYEKAHIINTEKDGIHQMDLLYLPNDDGYKYALVIVDLATRLTDAEPIKAKTDVLDAIKTIYRRGILHKPKIIQIDAGPEFKGDVRKYFDDNNISVRVGKPGRHKQQSMVENRNKIIGKALFTRMAAQELNTGEPSKEWVKYLPKVIKEVNERYEREPISSEEIPDQPICKGDNCKLLSIGDKVRIKLDEPEDILTSKRLHGRFRAGDTRYENKERTIENILIYPDEPPMYVVSGLPTTAYTKEELQKIPPNEQNPPDSVQERFIVERILDKKRMKGHVYYKVKWQNYKKPTWEPRTVLIEDIPQMIRDYEASQNRS